MADFTETFRLRLDLTDISGAAAAVQREVARIRTLTSEAAASPAGGTRDALRGQAAAALPALQRRSQELAAVAGDPKSGLNYAYPYGGAKKLAAEVQQEVAQVSQAVSALETLPPALRSAGQVSKRIEAATAAANAGGARGQIGRLEELAARSAAKAGSYTAATPLAHGGGQVARLEELAAREATTRGEVVATVRQRARQEERIRAVEADIESQARREAGGRGGGRGPGGTGGAGGGLGGLGGLFGGGGGGDEGGGGRISSLIDRLKLPTRFFTTASFAISGAALYGAFNTIRGMVEQATQLERIFNQINRQFESLGQGEQFAGFRSQILGISRETGEAAADVARVGFQFKGAFGDTEVAVRATSDAIKIARVTGLELNEVIDSLTAAAYGFRQGGESQAQTIERIGDEALGLQERFGVLAKESVRFLGDIAPVAQEAGLSLREMGALIGVAQQTSGRAGSALAESFGRILPAIHEASVGILTLYQTAADPKLRQRVPDLAQAIRSGETGQVLIRLVRDWGLLDQAQKNQVISLLGGRREAQALIPVLENSGKVIEELDRKTSDAGKTSSYFSDLQDTLAQRIARAKQEIISIGDALYRAGLGEVLKDLVTVGGGLLAVLAGLLHIFGSINEATHGWAARILEVVIAIKILRGLAARGLIEGILFGSVGGAGGSAASLAGVGLAVGNLSQKVREVGVTASLMQAGKGIIGSPLGQAGLALGAGYGAQALAEKATGRDLPPVFSALGNIGAGAAIAGPLGATAAAVLSVYQAYGSERAKVKKEGDKFKDSLAKATTEKLQELARDVHSSFIEGVSTKLFYGAKPEDLIQKELGKRYAETADRRIQSLRESGVGTEVLRKVTGKKDIVFDEKFAQQLEDMIKEGGETGKAAMTFLNKLTAGVADAGGETLQKYRDALKTYDATKSAKAAGDLTKVDPQAGVSEAAKSAQEVMSQLQSGVINEQQAIAKLAELKSAYEQIGTQALDPKQAAEYASIVKQIAQIQGQTARKAIDFKQQIMQSLGLYDPAQAAAAYAQLSARPDVDDETRKQAALDAAKATGDIFNLALKRARSGKELQDLLAQGVPVPAEVQALAAQQGVSIPAVVGMSEDQQEQIKAKIRQRLAAIRSYQRARAGTDPIAGAAAEIDAANDEIAASVPDSAEWYTAQAHLLQAQAQARNAQNQIRQARYDIRRAQAQGDPLALAQLDLAAANDDYSAATNDYERMQASARIIQARTAIQDANVNIVKAQLGLLKQQAAGDPIGQANLAIAEAQVAVDTAHGTAERLNAMAQLVAAQQQLGQAQVQIADAYRNIEKALAQAAGDTVRVAQIELEGAQAHLASASARGDVLGQLQARAEIIAAQAGVVAAQIQVGQRNIDFAMQIGQISTQQAIAQLEGLLLIPGITQEQTQALLLKIHQLREEVAKDATFDIPSEIRLPTLYEARRLRQSEAAGGGYQDNRIVQVQYNAFNGQDHDAALQDLQGVLAGAPRAGVTPRSY